MQSNDSMTLLAKLNELLSSEQAKAKNNEGKVTRKKGCDLANELWLELVEPGDFVDKIVYQTQENAMVRVGHDLGIYHLLVDQATPLTYQELAAKTGADPVLMERILRNLAALGHIEETGPGTFKANRLSEAFTSPKGVSMAKFGFEFLTPAWNQIPSFLKAHGYQNPVDTLDGPVQQAFYSKKHFFELIVEQNVLETFQTAMTAFRTDRAEFLDIFPAAERLVSEFDGTQPQGVMFVDVGGGHGHEIAKFKQKFPDIEGRMVLQDQTDVVNQVPPSAPFESMSYNFFEPQPIKGARCYYFRMIMHDWPDDKCIDILKNQTEAMIPGYSKLLINDVVMPDQGATRFAAQSDINMLALLSAMERSEAQWRRLLEQVGLEVVKVWRGTPESVIETMLQVN